MNVPQELRQIWRVTMVTMSNFGFTAGLYLYTWAAYFHDLFIERQASEETAMMLMAIQLMLHLGLIALLEVPLGAVGDALGRRKTVLWSLIFRAFFFAGLAGMVFFETLFTTYMCLIFASIAFSINYTLFSGTFTAWLVDSCIEQSPTFGYERLIGRCYMYRQVTIALGCLVGMYLYLHELIFVAYGCAAFACIATLVYCKEEMQETAQLHFSDVSGVSLGHTFKRIAEIITLSLRICRNSRPVLGLIGLFASFIFLVNIIQYYWPVAAKSHLQLSENSLQWTFLVVAITMGSALGSLVFTKYSDMHERRYNCSVPRQDLRHWLTFSALVIALPIVALSMLVKFGKFPALLFFSAVFAAEGALGMFTPVYESIFNKFIPNEYAQERATLLSLGSMLRSVFVLLLAVPSSGSSGVTTVAAWIIPASLLLVVWCFAARVLKGAESDSKRAYGVGVEVASHNALT